MISGMTTFTVLHVVISLVGIFSGLIVLFGLLSRKRLDRWTAIFLVGAISLVALALAIVARYRRQLAGGWRRTYVIGAVIALYLNVFVLVVQLFEKVPVLKALAPTQSEAPFVVTQLVIMAIFAGLGIAAAKRFRDQLVLVRDRPARAA